MKFSSSITWKDQQRKSYFLAEVGSGGLDVKASIEELLVEDSRLFASQNLDRLAQTLYPCVSSAPACRAR